MSDQHTGAAGRFRPASDADFSTYARNLAWLLQCSRQEAQELLARAYGYAGLHELQAVMARPGAPGPYDEPTRWPLFRMDVDAPASVRQQPEDFGWMLHSAFDTRWRELIQHRAASDYLSRRELGCLEAGFFCAPKQHRRLFARVKQGCIAQEGTTEQHQAWLELNWPVGYWPLLRILYGYAPNVVVPTDYRQEGRDYRVDPSCVELCQYRAPSIYRLMTAPFNHLRISDQFWGNEPVSSDRVCLSAGRPGLFPQDYEALSYEIHDWHEGLMRQHGLTLTPENAEVVGQGDEAFLEAGATDTQLLHPLVRDVPGYADALRSHRLRELQTQSWEHAGFPGLAGLVVLSGRRAWPNKSANVLTTPAGALLDTRISMAQREVYETQDCHMSLWRYHARFAQLREDGSTAAHVGDIYGWYVVPYDDKYLVHPNDFFECMDAASAQLNDVWKVLQGAFFPSLGVASVADYVGRQRRHAQEFVSDCIATAEIELEPSFRGQGLVPSLLNQMHALWEELPHTCIDSEWTAHAYAAADREFPAHPLDMAFDNPGVSHFDAPGVFVLPVEGAAPDSRVLMPFLRGSLHKVRKANPHAPEELRKQKLTAHFESMRGKVNAELICYDPYDYPGT